ncbi:MAG: NAD(P)H-dependent oxidoreductase [Candidatus Omnitrophica bacterium]|nr:NAD(P)H-dependent oxidoreductase [Candidatus Omnitrophota bacterium]MBU1928423.1 NAD(P)H-dependent oxidoreductase [Candidatus Omnitrophota bacterium]MBU2034305.1 NAD(P)H-dependent oxidoreductase [Candidatus Omnitrophota bacterium]MBU2258251.1 NAD(P)H-dependent oxidoreductase [Candidatus Omnitrophota bacterium]
MAQVLVIYYSQSGNTKKMAEEITRGIKEEGVDAVLKDVIDTRADELLKYDGIVIGSPTYYGTMAFQVKKLLDETVKFHGKLEGKVGAAFASSANIAGGNETTILDIINAMLIHGMVIQGDPQGDHYGPVSIGAPDSRALKNCLRLGGRIARLVKRCTV